jgi:hypothetical protein
MARQKISAASHQDNWEIEMFWLFNAINVPIISARRASTMN